MYKKFLTLALIAMFAFTFVMPRLANAGSLPETPITRILAYKTGLQLTDTQAKNLELINNNIINKMLQFKSQAQICKTKIDQYKNNWSDLSNPLVKSAIKEYYQCQAELKALEFEAMAQAGKILSKDQIAKFSDQVAFELMMIDSQNVPGELN